MFFFNLAGRCPSKLKGAGLAICKIWIITLVLCVKAIFAFLNKIIKKEGLNLNTPKNVVFRGREQYLDRAAPVESSSPLPGASPISKSVQKVVKLFYRDTPHEISCLL